MLWYLSFAREATITGRSSSTEVTVNLWYFYQGLETTVVCIEFGNSKFFDRTGLDRECYFTRGKVQV